MIGLCPSDVPLRGVMSSLRERDTSSVSLRLPPSPQGEGLLKSKLQAHTPVFLAKVQALVSLPLEGKVDRVSETDEVSRSRSEHIELRS